MTVKLDDGLVLPYRIEATTPCAVTQPSAQAFAYYAPETRGSSGSQQLRAARPAPDVTAAARP